MVTHWIETERGVVGVTWSREMSSYTWSCIYGCFGFDFEGESEAARDYERHNCPMGF